ncbi:MAG: tetratricopeptide repeat protein [Alphaproteobacteria bacterium]|nr:tetratricopeptide repeat protein [Alphaproteobacteria bacterium]
MLICVVEEWADSGEPSEKALLAQIRALMELRSFDRAWARLKPLLEAGDEAETFRLAGRLLLERGELKDARTTLARGRHLFPDDAELKQLLSQTDEPGTVIDLTDPMEDDPDGQAVLAARLLVEGAPLKARRLLERVRKSHPDHTRTADLLWALDGDFRLRGVTLADLARVHATPTQSLVDLPEDTDQTMESDDPTDDDLDAGAAFPSLFKNLEEQTEAYGLVSSTEEPEVTQVSAIVTDAGEANEVTQETTREDTQIMHVVRTAGHQPDASAADTLVDGTFDLKAYEQSLKGESEDENVVLHRKANPERTVTETDGGSRIKLDPSRDRVQIGANAVDEGAEFIRPRKKPQVTIEPAPPKAPVPQTPKVPKPKAAAPTPAPPAKRAAQKAPPPKPPAKPAAKPVPKPPTPATPASASNAPTPVIPPARAATPEPAGRRASERPTLTAAPTEASAIPTGQAVTLERIPTDERPRLDPALAAAPTEILDDPMAPPRRTGFAPYTGWLLVLVLLLTIILSMGGLLILYQVVTSL